MTLSKAAKAEMEAQKESAIKELREMFKPGDTVTTVLRHVSQSGMSRSISVIGPDMHDVSFFIVRAMGEKFDDRWGGVKIGGCGMDMGFSLVYGLSRTLYPQYNCTGNRSWGDRCPSNTHVNPGDEKNNYSPSVVHTDGYALSQRWL